MVGYRPADWGAGVDNIENAAGNALYKRAELNWTTPTVWHRADATPTFETYEPCLYALVRSHGNMTSPPHIEYVGLTTSPANRFGNHPTAREIVERPGVVKFTYAPIDFVRGRDRLPRIGEALEEIEHLLIWAVWEHLQNQRKLYTLPGMGQNGGNAWHIVNSGYRFSGRMPKEIIFPWMLVKRR